MSGGRWGRSAFVAAALLFGNQGLQREARCQPAPDSPAAGTTEALPAVLRAEQARIEAIGRASRTAVAVFGPGGRGGGSGVVISPDGYALTNFHVVKPAGNLMKCGMLDGVLYDAVLVGLDPTGDVALIKLLGRDDFPTAELGDSDSLRVGDWCFAVGNPFLLATDFQPTVTYGIVSGVHRYQEPAGTLLEYADCIQTDAAINPGNSGGPLFNAQGQLIGINGRGSFEKRGRVNVGVGYAISINQIKHFMGCLRSGRIVDHATLGASVSSDDEGRVIVSNIIEASDAYRRGLRYGDEVVAFGGRDVTTVNGFKNVLGIFPRGWRVPMTYRREGERHDIYVRLAGVHDPLDLITKVQGPLPDEQPQPDKPEGDKPEGDRPEGDKPEGDKPEGDNPPGPRPRPLPLRPGQPPARPVPPELAKLFEERRGFANFHFNRLNRDRVWNRLLESGDFTTLGPSWTLRGTMAGQPVVVELGPQVSTGEFPLGPARVDLAEDLADQLGPAGTGGLLAALHCWQAFLQQGPDKFGEVSYWGTMSLPGETRHLDVLVADHNVVECWFFFDPDNGRLVAMEMVSDPDYDPCELHFRGEREEQGRKLPAAIEIRFGEVVVGTIEWEQFTFGAPADKSN